MYLEPFTDSIILYHKYHNCRIDERDNFFFFNFLQIFWKDILFIQLNPVLVGLWSYLARTAAIIGMKRQHFSESGCVMTLDLLSYVLSPGCKASWDATVVNSLIQWLASRWFQLTPRGFSHESILQNLNDRFELRIILCWSVYILCKLASHSVIWITQFKWWSQGVFQWCISPIMQRNRRMNALTSKLWWGGGGGGSYVTF